MMIMHWIKHLFNKNKKVESSEFLQEIRKIADDKIKERDDLFKSKGFDYDKLIKLIKEKVAESIIDDGTIARVYLDDIFSEKLSSYELKKIAKYVNDFFGKRVAKWGSTLYGKHREYIQVYINEVFDKI